MAKGVGGKICRKLHFQSKYDERLENLNHNIKRTIAFRTKVYLFPILLFLLCIKLLLVTLLVQLKNSNLHIAT